MRKEKARTLHLISLAVSASVSTAIAGPTTTLYHYDDEGNRIAVDSLLITPGISATAVEPAEAVPGQRLNIYGQNFPWQQRDLTMVMFGGVPVQPIRMSERVITVEIPKGVAGDVPLSLFAPGFDPVDLGPFSVVGIRLDPNPASLVFNEAVSFSPTLVGISGDLVWSVDGVSGGSATTGLIDESGLYAAPGPNAQIPLPFQFRVSAEILGKGRRGTAIVRSGWSRELAFSVDRWSSDELTTNSEIVTHTLDVDEAGTYSLIANTSGVQRLTLVGPNGIPVQSSLDARSLRWRDLQLLQTGEYRVWIASTSGAVGEHAVGVFDAVEPGDPFTWVGQTGSWHDETLWLRGQVPGENADVTIDVPGDRTITYSTGSTILGSVNATNRIELANGTLTINESSEISGGVTQSSATLAGLGTLTVSSYAWPGAGQQRDAGRTVVTGDFSATSSNTRTLNDGRVLELQGTGLWATGSTGFGYTWGIRNGASLEIASGAEMEMRSATGNRNLSLNGQSTGPLGSVVNNGLLRKTGSTNLSIQTRLPFFNTGTTRVEDGVMVIAAGGENSGSMEVSEGATLQFNTTYTHLADGTITGPGALNISNGTHDLPAGIGLPTGGISLNGTVTVNGPIDPSSPVTLNSGTATFSGDQTLDSLTHSNMTLAGLGTLTVSSYAWPGAGQQRDAGRTVVTGDFSATSSNTRTLNDGRVLELQGTGLWATGSTGFGYTWGIRNGASLEIASGAEMEMRSATGNRNLSLNGQSTGPLGSVVNNGLLRKTGSTNLSIQTRLPFFNTGTTRVEDGVMVIAAGGENSGSMEVSEGATLQFNTTYTHLADGTITGPGALNISNGTHDLPAGIGLPTGGISLSGTVTVNGPIDPSSPVTLNNGTVTFTSDQTLDSLSHSITTVGGAGNLTLSSYSWTGGGTQRDAARTVVTGNFSATDATGRLLTDGRTLELQGTGLWAASTSTSFGSTWTITNGASLEIASGAEMEMRPGSGNRNITLSGQSTGPLGSVVNNGVLRKTGTRNLFIQTRLPFFNTGTVRVEGGLMRISAGGENSGSMEVSEGATLQFNTTYTHLADGTITGPGALNISNGTHDLPAGIGLPTGGISLSGTVTVNGPIDPSSPVTLNNGTVTFTSDQTLDSLSHSITTVGGAGNLTLSSYSWTGGGTQRDAARTVVTGNLSATDATGRLLTDGRTLELQGTGLWAASTSTSFGSTWTITNGASLEIASGAEMEMRPGSGNRNITLSGQSTGPLGSVVNNGVLRKTGTRNLFIQTRLPFFNTGTVRVEGGLMRISAGGENSGSMEVSEGATLQFNTTYTHLADGTITGPGALNISNGTHDLPAGIGLPTGGISLSGTVTVNGPIDPSSPVTLNNGTVTFTSDQTLDSLSHSITTVGGAGNLTLSSYSWTGGGTQRDAARTVVTGNFSATDATGRLLTDGRTLELQGTGLWAASTSTSFGSTWTITNGASLEIASGAEMEMRPGSGNRNITLSGQSTGPLGSVVNNGVLRKTGTRNLFIQTRLPFFNTGTVRVEGGLMRISAGGENSGSMEVSEGATLQFNSTYTHLADGTITGPGSLNISGGTHTFAIRDIQSFARIDIMGAVSLGGDLAVIIDPDYVPVEGDEFAIVRGASVSGSFGNSIDEDLGNGLRLRSRIENDGGVTLFVSDG